MILPCMEVAEICGKIKDFVRVQMMHSDSGPTVLKSSAPLLVTLLVA